jgi:hypothetical protein
MKFRISANWLKPELLADTEFAQMIQVKICRYARVRGE